MSGIVEKLIRLVARAFYTDEVIVVLDALIRDRFLKDDELDVALNLQGKQVRQVLTVLERDRLVCSEQLNDRQFGGKSVVTYYYIDYKYVRDVIMFRLWKMNEFLKKREKEEMVRIMYKCQNPSCGSEYTALEAQRLMAGNYEFRCGHCGEPLIEDTNDERLSHVQKLQRKLNEHRSEDGILYHEGINGLLKQIADYLNQGGTLPTNLPSENRDQHMTSKVHRGGGGGGGGMSGGGPAGSYLYPKNMMGQEIVIEFEGIWDHGEETDRGSFHGLKRKRMENDDVDDRALKKVASWADALKGGTPVNRHGLSNGNGDDGESLKGIQTDEEFRAEFDKRYNAKIYGNGSPRPLMGTRSPRPHVRSPRASTPGSLRRHGYIDLSQNGWQSAIEAHGVDWEDPEGPETKEGPEDAVDISVSVGGRMVPLKDVTEEDEGRMTDQEFQDYYALIG